MGNPSNTTNLVALPVLGEIDVDAIYRNPAMRFHKRKDRMATVINEELIEKAKRIGAGNFSKGVRMALNAYIEDKTF